MKRLLLTAGLLLALGGSVSAGWRQVGRVPCDGQGEAAEAAGYRPHYGYRPAYYGYGYKPYFRGYHPYGYFPRYLGPVGYGTPAGGTGGGQPYGAPPHDMEMAPEMMPQQFAPQDFVVPIEPNGMARRQPTAQKR